jgi:hypothetical protein
MNSDGWEEVAGRLLAGHRVASGLNGDPRFPGGTLHLQAPHFRALGLDLAAFHPGTLNVSIAPRRYCVVRPRLTFRRVRWHPTEPAEDFSFFDVRLGRAGAAPLSGLIYFPHPETKPAHFQPPDVLELLFPFVAGLHYGAALHLQIPVAQIRLEPAGDESSSGFAPTAR